ncbi:MAG: recombination protein RecR [Candidatus Cloacimonadota bacterium]|jgi:recombination protein RecR|nr:recombination protein RecR [Candidatus Cloacimonadota bacterium]
MFQGLLAELEKNLKRLPGIGSKSAQRLAMFILNDDKASALKLANSIKEAVETYTHCSVCNMLSETDPCEFCSDDNRDNQIICVVENTQDIYLIENTHAYNGTYYVLNDLLSPLDGIGPEQINFAGLQQLISKNKVSEVILALSPSTEGETTMNFLAEELASQTDKITRLSTGLPFGGDIEYTSSLTLINAFKRRYNVKENG